MLGWACQPAGTWAGSPGKAGGGVVLGVWATGRTSNPTEMGGAGFRRRWGTGALDMLGWGSQGGIFQDLAWL